MPFSVELIRKLERVSPELREVLLALLEEVERQREASVTKKEFLEFARQTNENFQKVWKAIRELAEAQKETEKKIKELTEAQRETDRKMKELADAQRRTEEKVEELAEAQKRTEERVEELAKALKQTQDELRQLAREHEKTRSYLGDLSDTVGYTLENAAYRALPELLKRDHGIEVVGRLKRGYLKDLKGKDREVNILGKARKDGRTLTIIGESKARLSKKQVNEFIKKRLKRFEGLYGEVLPVMVAHMVSEPDVEDYAASKGIILYLSYDF